MIAIPTISLVGATTATILILVFGGGKGLGHYLANSDKAIKQAVEDKERRSEILKVTKQFSKDLKKEQKAYSSSVEDWLDLHQNYETMPEDFNSQADEIMKQQHRMIETILDTREAMKSNMTAEEWRQVFGE